MAAALGGAGRMILVALGSNLRGDDGAGPEENCAQALALIQAAGVAVLGRSRWYRSAAWPRSGQPDFVNGVARVATDASPEELLAALHDIEARMGRRRGARNAARVIDLDLLAFGRTVRGGDPAGLQLPHPRLQDRAFVLYPLREVAPGWIHPVNGRSVDEMIAALDDDLECAPIEDSAGNVRKIQ